jgi:hypothetical protein
MLVAMLAQAAPSTLAAEPPPALAAFVEQFDGPPQTDVWRWESGEPRHIDRCRHAPALGRCASGVCEITARRLPLPHSHGDRDWLCESLSSREPFGFGYFEARLAMAPAAGFNSAFWLRTPISEAGEFCEIDIVEAHYPRRINTNLHTHLPELRSLPERFTLDRASTGTGFHRYGMLFSSDRLAWYLDGRLIRWMTTPEACRRPMRLRLSIAVLDWAGEVPSEVSEAAMAVDYVLFAPWGGP